MVYILVRDLNMIPVDCFYHHVITGIHPSDKIAEVADGGTFDCSHVLEISGLFHVPLPLF